LFPLSYLKIFEAYYQEAGLQDEMGTSDAILLFSPQDIQINIILLSNQDMDEEHKKN